MKPVLAFVLLFLSCHTPGPKQVVHADFDDQYASILERTIALSEDGWVVSRDAAGEPHARGDSLIWTGILLGVAPCDYVSPLYTAFSDGHLFRHPALANQISVDGVLGLYYGIASRLRRCGDKEALKAAFLPHFTYTVANRGLLNPNSDIRLDLEFTYIRDLIALNLGIINAAPTNRNNFQTMINLWVFSVMAKNASCYRVHLGWLAFRVSESFGGLSNRARGHFCWATDDAGLPLIDHWCGRGDLLQWMQDFQVNEWEYRHQRCPARSEPDGQGYERPGIDFLIAFIESKE